MNVSAQAAEIKFIFPVDCTLNSTCWILNYMDANTDPLKAEDYTCGPRTYEGHMGIDIALRHLKAAENGVSVKASADGRVVYVSDGLVDTPYVSGSNVSTCGNGVVLLHDSGWETRYCHMMQNSIPVKKGDTVQKGQVLGKIGLSGATSWPHLGYTLLRNGQPFDPLSGRTPLEGCGLTPKPLWVFDQMPSYQPFSVFNLGFSVGEPDEAAIDSGEPKIAAVPDTVPSLSFWATTFGLVLGDRVSLQILKPDKTELVSKEYEVTESKPKGFYFLQHHDINWQPGEYTGIITLKRGEGKTQQETRWQRIITVLN